MDTVFAAAIGFVLGAYFVLGLMHFHGDLAIVEEYRVTKDACEAGIPRNVGCTMVFITPDGELYE